MALKMMTISLLWFGIDVLWLLLLLLSLKRKKKQASEPLSLEARDTESSKHMLSALDFVL